MTVRKHKRMSNVRKKRIIVLILIFIIFIMFFEMRLKPVSEGIASVQAQSMSTLLINQTVNDVIEEMNVKISDMEIISQTSSGVISSINTNTVIVNKLKNIISLRIQKKLSDVQNKRVDIPLGTVLGGEIFNGQGPRIPIYISLSGNVKSDFESKFESGGVNQSVHKLSVNISADITIIMPMGNVSTNVKTSVLIGETVIVGSVPTGMILKN